MQNKEQIIRRTREAIMHVLDGLSLLGVIEARGLEKKPTITGLRVPDAYAKPKKAVLRRRKAGALVEKYNAPDPVVKAIRRAGTKTAKMLAVLSDGLTHSAKELALAGGVTPGHVYQHLRSRIESGVVQKPRPGLFKLNGHGKKAKAA